MIELLQLLESGKPGRFDNRKRPQLLPARHPFHVTCPCFECAHVWEGGR